MKALNLYLLCFLLLIVSSCYKDEKVQGFFSDEFYLSHKDASLPIWVRGNENAETFIIFLHGGPFDTAIANAVWGHFEPLYEDYALVFFDQRGGGHSHGTTAENLNESQFVEDVEIVHQLILDKYPQANNFFLMGHSYGGYLGTAVLSKGENQSLFKGWIELAGAHNFPLNWAASRDFSIAYAEQKIDEDENFEEVANWKEKLEALENVTEVSNLDQLFVVNGIAFSVAADLNAGKRTFENPSLIYVSTSPVGAGFWQNNLELLEDFLVNGNLNTEMAAITLPSLLIYGAEDPIVPVALGQNGIDYLGTNSQDKFLVILENSGHSLWAYESELLFNEIKTFITLYE